MRANLLVLEQLQAIAGTSGGGNAVFNSTLPVLFPEFQKTQRVSDICGVITDSLNDVEGASVLVSAISDVRQKCDADLLAMKQKIAKGISDSCDEADRFIFLRLDEKTQTELAPIIAGDKILLAARKYMAAMPQAGRQSPQQ